MLHNVYVTLLTISTIVYSIAEEFVFLILLINYPRL